MLVLSRKEDQSIFIGEDIEVTILEIKDGNIKIGIEAPDNIKIYRKEIFDEIKSENSKAAHTEISDIEKILKSGGDGH
jgi:carbon storage regulator